MIKYLNSCFVILAHWHRPRFILLTGLPSSCKSMSNHVARILYLSSRKKNLKQTPLSSEKKKRRKIPFNNTEVHLSCKDTGMSWGHFSSKALTFFSVRNPYGGGGIHEEPYSCRYNQIPLLKVHDRRKPLNTTTLNRSRTITTLHWPIFTTVRIVYAFTWLYKMLSPPLWYILLAKSELWWGFSHVDRRRRASRSRGSCGNWKMS